MIPTTVPDTEQRFETNHGGAPLPPVVSVLCEAAERWQAAYYNAPMHGETARSANVALDEAVAAWINSPFREPARLDRGAVRAILDGFASHLLQMDARFRSGQYADEATYHAHRSDLTAETVARILKQVTLANPTGEAVP